MSCRAAVPLAHYMYCASYVAFSMLSYVPVMAAWATSVFWLAIFRSSGSNVTPNLHKSKGLLTLSETAFSTNAVGMYKMYVH